MFGEHRRERGRHGVSLIDYSRRWLAGCAGTELLDRWRRSTSGSRRSTSAFEPDRRLAWAGPDMSARSFMSARQMETWSHGQAIFDALGLERVEHDRLRNIAVMGVNTFGWTFTVHRRPLPAVKPYVRLIESVGRDLGMERSRRRRIASKASAVDFCRVVTQTRNVRDTALQVTGAVAAEWMAIAQCFAGPPETAAGPRHALPQAALTASGEAAVRGDEPRRRKSPRFCRRRS